MPGGTAQRAVVPPVAVLAFGSAAGSVPLPVDGAAPSVSPVQPNGAGPPCTVTSAVAGAVSSRNWSAWLSGAVADRVPGETEPTASPTATTWSTSASGAVSVPRRAR
ncbi:hypothetical protein SAMN05661080_02013 [Modestobacter sp. DSM 44400]|nr:hypothetical protein SAMN05661080_02013 [Modestobacter sp. DSM 44400]